MKKAFSVLNVYTAVSSQCVPMVTWPPMWHLWDVEQLALIEEKEKKKKTPDADPLKTSHHFCQQLLKSTP